MLNYYPNYTFNEVYDLPYKSQMKMQLITVFHFIISEDCKMLEIGNTLKTANFTMVTNLTIL